MKNPDSENIKKIVREKYGKIAGQVFGQSCCCGPSCCGSDGSYTVFSEDYGIRKGYNPDADLGLGCGIPTDFAGIKKGDSVLDLGSGAGNDCFVARELAGDEGQVTGLDMTEEMVKKARENCNKLKYKNVEFVPGDIENMPFKDGSFDVVISNCVLNLVPDKEKAFHEIFRVLKPGGHFCISDVVIMGTLPESLRKDAELYTGCVSGACEINDYLMIIKDTGFVDINIHKLKEIKLPESLLPEYSIQEEAVSSGPQQAGIFSLTVSAKKPV